MSSSVTIPPEIHDLITDHLHNDPTALKACCLVSKSWIHRTRKHLFASLEFQLIHPLDDSHPMGPCVESWKKTFPDPANSPAHHTRSLYIVIIVGDIIPIPAPLYGLFPTLRSLRMAFVARKSSDVFDLFCSFPCLEDLALELFGFMKDGPWNTPSTSPRLTGSLKLHSADEGIQSITRGLLDFPNGLHFTKITVAWTVKQDVGSTVDLVSRCSDTLQSLTIMNILLGGFPSISVPD